MSTVSVLGSINLDYVLTVERHPGPGETILANDLRLLPGGKGANQAIAAARFGADVHMIGCVGDDPAGASLLEQLGAEGVDTTLVTRAAGRSSGRAFITLAADKENSIVVAPGANAVCDATKVNAAADMIRRSDVVVAQLEIPLAAVECAVAIASERRETRFMLNASPPQRLSVSLLERIDVLVVNEHEAQLLRNMREGTGAAYAAAAARSLVEAGSPCVVVTCGVDGAVCALPRDGDVLVTRVPAPRVDPVDSTGAGDAFAGALAVSLGDGDVQGIVSAVRFAVAAGSLATTVVGAQGHISLAQVNALLTAMAAVRRGDRRADGSSSG